MAYKIKPLHPVKYETSKKVFGLEGKRLIGHDFHEDFYLDVKGNAYSFDGRKLRLLTDKKDTFVSEKSVFTLEKSGYEDGEWANQFYVWRFKDKEGKEIVVYYDHKSRISPYSVIFDGAVDFDGNKKELLAKYPELKGVI